MEIRDSGLGVIPCNLCITQPKSLFVVSRAVALARAGRATQDGRSFVFPGTIALCRGSAHILSHLLSNKSVQIAVTVPYFHHQHHLASHLCEYHIPVAGEEKAVVLLPGLVSVSYEKSFQSSISTRPRPSIATYNVHLIRIKLAAG